MNKKKMRKILYIYIAVILILFFFSKTIYHYSLPKVTVAKPISGILTKEIEAYGTANFSDTYDILSNVSGQIDNLYFNKSDTITKGSTIADIKTESKEEDELYKYDFTIKKLEKDLENYNLDIQSLNSEINLLNKELDNSYEDKTFEIEIQAIEESIKNKENELQRSKRLLDEGVIAKIDYDKIQEEYNELLLSKEKRVLEFENNKSEFENNNQKDFEENKNAILKKQEEINKINISIEKINLQIEETKLEKESYLNKPEEPNTIISDYSGIIIESYKQKGSVVSTGESVAKVAVNNNQFITEINADTKQSNFIEIGDSVEIKINGIKDKITGTVKEITNKGETNAIKIDFEAYDLKGGESLKINVKKNSEHYDILIPNESLVKENFNTYVWTVKYKHTVMGFEYYVSKVKIFISDYDDNYTAVSKGIEEYINVVTSYDKDLKINGRVIEME